MTTCMLNPPQGSANRANHLLTAEAICVKGKGLRFLAKYNHNIIVTQGL